MSGPAGPLELLVFQVTPFCNLDCAYCYLPDRLNRRSAEIETLRAALEFVWASGLAEDGFTLAWHAGEPLAAPKGFYAQANARLADFQRETGISVRQTFQTNGTLIDDWWCGYFARNDVRVGVSIDGPAWLHDKYRRTRSGKGSHAHVMRGVELLKANGVDFAVLCVLTEESLDHPDELFEFFSGLGATRLGFNIDEIDGANTSSSMALGAAESRFRRFFARLYDLTASRPGPAVREFEAFKRLLLADPLGRDGGPGNQEATAFKILSVDHRGFISTFSPELLATSAPEYNDFRFGRLGGSRYADVLREPAYRAVRSAIDEGVARCRDTCPYFAVCGGGKPVNKYCETGSLASTETLHCRLQCQALADVILAGIERHGS